MWKDKLKTRRSRLNRSASGKKKLAKYAKYVFFTSLALIIISFIAIPLFAFTLPTPDKIVRRDGFSTKILDRNGQVLYDIFLDERRTPVENIDDVPEYLRQATIAIEDKNFYKHGGFDIFGMVRGISRIFTRGYAQGGSTLTQQLVKNVLLTSERSVARKVKEFVLAVQIEQKYSKDEILLLYLNEAPYGGTAYGVESASEIYFGKSVSDLNLVESAFLAGLPQRPSVYSPFSSTPDAYIARATEVLRRMREDDYITREQEEAAKDQLSDIEFQERTASFKAPHFVQYVQRQLEDKYGTAAVEQGGLIVTTSLDLELQTKAQELVADEISDLEESHHITNGAAVVVDPETGEILSMVGSKDFYAEDYDGQVNVTTSLRQPGSTMKPFTYVTAIKEGYTASSLIMDVPTIFPGGADLEDYEPVNYDGEYRGPVQLRYALANSINVAAVKVLALVGVRDTLKTAYDMGLTTLEPTNETMSRVGLSLTLGGGEVRLVELTSAFAGFVNKGHRVEPVSILKIVDHDGNVLEENEPKKGRRVISEAEAFIIADILSSNESRSMVFGTNSLLNIPGQEVAVKTGTTNDLRDNWAVGGNDNVVVGVWVGNNDNSKMRAVASGVSGATPIWRNILIESLKGKPKVTFEQPDNVVTASVDSVSGFRAHDGFPERAEKFIKGTEPGEDLVHVNLKLCKADGKLATPSQVAAKNYNLKEYFVFEESDPTASAGDENRWQNGIEEWLTTQTDERYKPPKEYCQSGNSAPLNIEFVSPRDRDSNLDNDFNVKFVIDFVNPIEEAWIEVDGVIARSFTSQPYEYNLTLQNGVHKLRAAGKDSKGNQSERIITIGVNTEWDAIPTPTP